jgi:hypothetical protein
MNEIDNGWRFFYVHVCMYYITCDHIFMYQSNEIIYNNKLTISLMLYIIYISFLTFKPI